jgi:hypothetical protein
MKRHSKSAESRHPGSRRAFLKRFGLLAGVSVVPKAHLARITTLLQSRSLSDEEICRGKFEIALKESLATRPIGEIMVAIGTSFLGTPYVPHTLEAPGPEELVVNLKGLDCVTFVENTVALSRCVKLGQHTYEEYRKQLQLIRYREGKIDGYPSRLHYFSDWIFDNTEKKIVRDMTREIGGIPYMKTINFMSAHRESYRQLSDNTFVESIRRQEQLMSGREKYYIPKEILGQYQHSIQPGDIIGITTAVEGLDISHTGIAVHVNGVVKYLHAPLANGAVQISHDSFVDYLTLHKNQTGVMVARPLEPHD